jgi:citrate lyase subunit beta/citryl-CoA lyase
MTTTTTSTSSTSTSGQTRPWLRSLLFIPAHKTEWIMKATKYGSDALILDLEDSVPGHMKAAARRSITDVFATTALDSTPTFVRVNGWGTGGLIHDVLEVASPKLTGFLLSKTASPQDIHSFDRLLDEAEARHDIPPGQLEILPLLETARSVELASEIFRASPRIARVSAIAGLTPGMPGDLHRSLGVDATEEGDEMLYASGRMLVGARAAGIKYILGGMTVNILDQDLLRRSLLRAKRQGSTGTMAIHPSHIPLINEIFTPSEAEIDAAVALVRALGEAYARGDAAVIHGPTMIDRAHARVAMILLGRAKACGLTVPDFEVHDEWIEDPEGADA